MSSSKPIRLVLAAISTLASWIVLVWIISLAIPANTIELPEREIQESGIPCSKLKEEIKSMLLDARACETDAQCTVIRPGCPFGCSVAINRERKPSVLAEISVYRKSTCDMCMYGCLALEGRPLCEAGECRIVPLPEKP